MSSKGYEYWATHLAAIAEEGIETKAYARRESLSVSALYYWRRRIKVQQHGPHPLTAVPQPKGSGRKLFMPVLNHTGNRGGHLVKVKQVPQLML